MPDGLRKGDLTPARRRLIELMQEINYGRIEGLQIQEGDPVFTPMPRVFRLFLFGKDNGPNRARECESFAVKKKITELFGIFDREPFLSIQELIIDNGLPVRMTVTGTGQALQA